MVISFVGVWRHSGLLHKVVNDWYLSEHEVKIKKPHKHYRASFDQGLLLQQPMSQKPCERPNKHYYLNCLDSQISAPHFSVYSQSGRKLLITNNTHLAGPWLASPHWGVNEFGRLNHSLYCLCFLLPISCMHAVSQAIPDRESIKAMRACSTAGKIILHSLLANFFYRACCDIHSTLLDYASANEKRFITPKLTNE